MGIKRENREIEGKMERELLKKTIKNEIEKSANFVQVKSQIRKAVYESLTNNKINKQNQLSNRQTLVLSLVTEWLKDNGFEQSVATIRTETGLEKSLPTQIIQSEFGISDEDRNCSILDQLVVSQLKNKIGKENIELIPTNARQADNDYEEVEFVIEK